MLKEGKVTTEQRFYGSGKSRPVTRRPQQESNHNHRWLRKISLGILLLATLIWGWQKLSDPKTLPIRAVQIEGSMPHIDKQALRQAILPAVQVGFLKFDASGLHDRLLQLPWVATAEVKRVWPDSIKIIITEQKPVARFGNDSLVNDQGEVFSLGKTSIPANLPLFVGPLGQQKQMVQAYQAMNQVLAPLSLNIVTLVLDTQQFWRVRLNNGLVIFIGRIDPLKRLERFVEIYPQVIGNRASMVNYVDLRYAHGVAVRYKSQGSIVSTA